MEIAKSLREICGRYRIIVDLAIAICEYLNNAGEDISLAQILNAPTLVKKIKLMGEGTPALTVLIWKGSKETDVVCLFRPYDLKIMPPPMDTEATEDLLTALAYRSNSTIFEAKFVSIQRIKATMYKGRPLVTSVSNSVCQSEPLIRIAQQYIKRHPAILEAA